MDADESTAGWWSRVSLAALAMLAVAWFVLAVTNVARTATGGTAAGIVLALAITAAGLASVVRAGSERAARLLAAGLFVVGIVATLLSVNAAGQTVANDVATAVSDVAILSALGVVLALKTETGRDAIAE